MPSTPFKWQSSSRVLTELMASLTGAAAGLLCAGHPLSPQRMTSSRLFDRLRQAFLSFRVRYLIRTAAVGDACDAVEGQRVVLKCAGASWCNGYSVPVQLCRLSSLQLESFGSEVFLKTARLAIAFGILVTSSLEVWVHPSVCGSHFALQNYQSSFRIFPQPQIGISGPLQMSWCLCWQVGIGTIGTAELRAWEIDGEHR